MISVIRENKIFFEKRDVGWKITTINYYEKDTTNVLFWDAKKNTYNKINFPSNPNHKVEKHEIKNFIYGTDYSKFNDFKYYGYVGWYQDLIKLYENKYFLSDDELYSLACAYSSYGYELLIKSYDFSDNKINFNLPHSKNSMNEEQLKLYLSIKEKAINTYLKLYIKNPLFETNSGPIRVKYHNEISNSFLLLKVFQNDQIASLQIEGKELYSDNYKTYAKNILDSCDKNSILFSDGEYNLLPLIVYQSQNNYRTDVLIVEANLLNSVNYTLYVKEKVLDDEGMKSSINYNFIKDDLSKELLLAGRNKEPFNIKNLNSIFINEDNMYEINFKSYKSFETRDFSFNEGSYKLKWTFNEKKMFRNQLMMLDIIANNNWKRPIYFVSIGMHNSNYLGLSEYLQFEGLVYKLVSKGGEISDEEIGFVEPTKLEQNLKKMYQFKNTTNLSNDERIIVMFLRMIRNRLANYYIEQDNFNKAESILDECMNLYPNDLAYFSFDIRLIIESYYKIKSFEKAKVLEIQLLKNFENGLDNYMNISEEERKIKYERTKENLRLTKGHYGVK